MKAAVNGIKEKINVWLDVRSWLKINDTPNKISDVLIIKFSKDNFVFKKSLSVRIDKKIIIKFKNLKCPIMFLKVNLTNKDMCAISLPRILFSPKVKGKRIYCCIKFCKGIFVIKRKTINIINIKNDPNMNI